MRMRRPNDPAPSRLADSRNAVLRDAHPRHRFGRGTYGPLRVLDFDDADSLEIGNFTSIAEGVTILTGGNHRAIGVVVTTQMLAADAHLGPLPPEVVVAEAGVPQRAGHLTEGHGRFAHTREGPRRREPEPQVVVLEEQCLVVSADGSDRGG